MESFFFWSGFGVVILLIVGIIRKDDKPSTQDQSRDSHKE